MLKLAFMPTAYTLERGALYANDTELWRFRRKQNLKDRENNKAQYKSQRSKLVSRCLKGGGVNKTHSHPLILSKWWMNKRYGAKNQRWTGSCWSGLIETGQKKEISNTLNFTQNRKCREPTDGADWAGKLQSPLYSPCWLIAASWERTSQVHPVACDYLWPRSWDIPAHIRTLENLWSVCNSTHRYSWKCSMNLITLD